MEENYSVAGEGLHVVRNHKDTVFRMIYKDRTKLLELYNALNGTDYEDAAELEVCTLENAIYMGMKNDVSFLFDSEMNLYEHQSTFNPNMPLRDLMYAAKQLEKYMAEDTLYSSKLVKIPVPRFVVFYNGTEKQPERRVLKLSDAYEKKVASPELELKVLMLNINQGNNRKLMQRCKTLKEYCQFVECIRKYAATMEIAEAVDRAVTECIKKNILADFLTKQRAEVVAVSIFEYNEEEELKKIRAAEFSVGREAGYEEGEAVGKAAGEVVGKAESVLELLEDLGEIPKELRERILSESNLPVLKQWLKAAAKSESLQAFLDQAGILDLD
ncbi:hypothetical protein BEI60_09720 [Eisenbergiella tayi]|nr:hypothetical protein BEI60_09720 [Eisenbergiella tayi]